MAENNARSDYRQLTSSSTRERLISSRYLHSSYWNFVNMFYATGQGAELRRQHLFAKRMYDDIVALSQAAKVIEKQFYEDFGVTDHIAFSHQYLLAGRDNTDKKNWPVQKKILHIMQSYDFIAAIRISIDQASTIENIVNKIASGTGLGKQDLMTILKQDGILDLGQFYQNTTKNLLDYVQKIANNDSQAALSLQQQIMSSLNMEKSNRLLRSAKSVKMKKAIQQNLKFELPSIEELFKNKLDEYFKKQCKDMEISEADTLYYLNRLHKVLEREFKKGIEATAFYFQNSQIGAIGELGLEVLYDFASVVGDTLEPRSTIQDEKEREKDTYSKTDLIFIAPNSKREYKIQAKNSFQQLFSSLTSKDNKYYSARMQESIKLKNLMDTLVAAPRSKGGITQETANEISYALMNFEFLSKTAGLEKSWKKNKDSSQKGNYEIQQMIGGLIQTGLFYFLGVEFEKATKNKPTVFTGNMFTILANRYLIPFSMYLDSIAEVMKEELREATIIAQRPATNIHLGDSSLNAKDMYQEKQELIRSDGFPKGYYYPDALVEIGQKGGESLYNNTTISGIHFKFNITKLQTIFKEKTEKSG